MNPSVSTIDLHPHRVPVLTLGQGPPLVFLQGFGIHPSHYLPLLTRLAQRHRVLAPDLLRPGAFPSQPTSIPQAATLVARLCDVLGLTSPVVVGHSMGGATAFHLGALEPPCRPRALIGINPALPVSYGPLGLISRSMIKGARESVGLSGGLKGVAFAARFHPPFLRSILAAPRASARFMAAAAALDYQPLRVPQPSLLAFGLRDEYFQLTPDLEARLIQRFDQLRIQRLETLPHDWPIFRPVHAARLVERFVGEVEGGGL